MMPSRPPSARMVLVLVVVALAVCARGDPAGFGLRAPRAASRLPSSARAAARSQQLPPPPARPAQPSQVRDRARAATGTAIIRGRVLAADTRAPLRRARVTWSSSASGGTVAIAESAPVVVTNDGGEYEIRGLPAGRYHVLARHVGYLQMEFAARRATGATRGPVADGDRGVTIDLADGQSFESADFYLPRAAAIMGRIVDEFGDSVTGATVDAARVETAGGRRQLIAYATDTTDDLGEYRVYGLPPGSYYLVASAPPSLRAPELDQSYPDAYYPGCARRDQAKPVAVSIGQELANIDFALSPMHVVRMEGLVRTSTGAVPRGGSVVVAHVSETGVSQPIASSGLGPEGNFTLRGIVPGEVVLTATTTSLRLLEEVATIPMMVGVDDMKGLFITTGEQATAMVSVKTDSGGALPFAPPSGYTPPVRITARSVNDGADGAGVTRETTLRTAAATTRTFTASLRPGLRMIGLAGLPVGWGIAAVASGTASPIDAKPNTILSVEVTISNRLPEISGSAADQQGRPVWEYSVVLFPRDPSRCFPGSPLVRNERTNQRGEFRLVQVTPGDYQIVAVSLDDDVDLSDAEALERLRARSTPLTVTYGDRKTVRLVVVRSAE